MKGAGGNGAVLINAIRDLLAHWERTASSWKDQARTGFEKEYIDELVPAVRSASNAVQQIEELLRQVYRECS